MSVKITLEFETLRDAATFLMDAEGPSPVMEVRSAGVIAPADRPDAGLDPAVVFELSPSAAPAVALPPAPPAVTPPSAAIAPTAAPSVDATGLPWDARIHSESKALNKDGTWRQKRGLNDMAFKGQIETELRAALAAPPAPAAVLPPAPAPTSAAAAPGVPAFAALLSKYSNVMAHNAAGFHESLAKALAPIGLTAFGQLAARPDLIPFVDSELQSLLPAA